MNIVDRFIKNEEERLKKSNTGTLYVLDKNGNPAHAAFVSNVQINAKRNPDISYWGINYEYR